jgi:amidophosphoribosyltransferase
VLLNVLAHEIGRASSGAPLQSEEIFKAVRAVHKRIKGSYAVIALIAGYGLLAFRDPFGIRPLCMGRAPMAPSCWPASPWRWKARGTSSSATWRRRSVFITTTAVHSQQCAEKTQLTPACSSMCTWHARLHHGRHLGLPGAPEHGRDAGQARDLHGAAQRDRRGDPDPESSRPSAMQLAQLLGKPYREGFVKNRYVGRTFIMPGQGARKKSVRQKLNAIGSEFKGRNVLLVDDSIVRGTTSKEIVQMARDAGANKVYLASAAPPVRTPTCTASTCPRAPSWWPRPHGRGNPPGHRLRRADLPGRGSHEAGRGQDQPR